MMFFHPWTYSTLIIVTALFLYFILFLLNSTPAVLFIMPSSYVVAMKTFLNHAIVLFSDPSSSQPTQLVPLLSPLYVGLVAYTCHLRTGEAQAGGLRVQDQSGNWELVLKRPHTHKHTHTHTHTHVNTSTSSFILGSETSACPVSASQGGRKTLQWRKPKKQSPN
jgi:hypothetical protein